MVISYRTFLLILSVIFISLFFGIMHAQFPQAFSLNEWRTEHDNMELLLLQNYSLPRIAIALLCGGILAFASLILQQIMGNSLVSDSTIGISAGAQFSLFLCAIFFPSLLEFGSSFVAFSGAALSLLLVLSLSWSKNVTPLLLVLAGLVVNLYLGSFSAIMLLFYPEESRGLMQWGAGSLMQESWRDTQWLLLQAIPAFILTFPFISAFNLLSLNEQNAQSLGVPVKRLRIIGIILAAYLISIVINAVGILGFIGLLTTTIIRQFSHQNFKTQLVFSFITGALLLAITDLILQWVNLTQQINLPTGAMTSLLGTPLLLWLMFRTLPSQGHLPAQTTFNIQPLHKGTFIFVSGGLLFSLWFALTVSQLGNQWHWTSFSTQNIPLFELRYPRILTAMSVGILLAVSGVLLQRLAQNPMASPELLGVSSGTGMGVLIAIYLFSARQVQYIGLAGVLGALCTLLLLIFINQRNGMMPEKVLLTGLSLSFLFTGLQSLMIATGDPKSMLLVSWTSGSTQQIQGNFAFPFFLITLGLFAISLSFSSWLSLFSLQTPMAQAVGLNVVKVRWILILFCALITALATLIIGPLSFIGLLVPHLSRFLGANRVHHHLSLAALLGAWIMVLADWIGRQLLYPYEIPAGLVVTLIGGAYFLLTMRKI
ncbi:MAG: Fe(3+)-hydroxamate ABC transporter permease FhuB [[Pasteurella] aerogenes]|nr:Fe(3+)-hydroxamate ABC transporter permease FhuB [[Pasteurella] aerogenes]